MKSTALLCLLYLACGVDSSRILVVFHMPVRSHYHLGDALARGLVEAGHDVTILSSFEEKNPPKNGTYRNIVLTGFVEDKEKGGKMSFFEIGNINVFLSMFFMNYIGRTVTENTFEHPNFKKLINSDEKFDLVIIEQFYDDALKVLSHHYDAPLILFSTIGANAWVNYLSGNPAPPSYVPDAFLSYTSNMTFKQRLVNWLFTVASELNRQFILYPSENRLLKKYFPDAPDLSELNYNASLIFLNSHESINQAIPLVPSLVSIGGFHVNPPKPLPKDLKDFMDSAKEGVVYFSMGTNIKPSQMTSDKREAILRALGKLKQKVLWKWDEDMLPGQPKNVKLSKWFPQQDILAHPNTKLFITHGGMLSTIETVYHGVPVLAFPVFGDQKMNAAKAETDGYGISLAFSELTEEKLTNALNLLLNNPKYRDNVKRRSQLMHDRPTKPLDLAVYWAEYVIRYRGAPHLRVAGVDLPWYIYFSLDVISFIALVIVASLVTLYVFAKTLKNLWRARNTNKDKLKKN